MQSSLNTENGSGDAKDEQTKTSSCLISDYPTDGDIWIYDCRHKDSNLRTTGWTSYTGNADHDGHANGMWSWQIDDYGRMGRGILNDTHKPTVFNPLPPQFAKDEICELYRIDAAKLRARWLEIIEIVDALNISAVYRLVLEYDEASWIFLLRIGQLTGHALFESREECRGAMKLIAQNVKVANIAPAADGHERAIAALYTLPPLTRSYTRPNVRVGLSVFQKHLNN